MHYLRNKDRSFKRPIEKTRKWKLENGLVPGPWTLFTLYQEYGSWDTTERTDFARERCMQIYGSKNCRMDLEEKKLVSCIAKM